MSTRRARIKAVASLPPRRRNLDNADKKKQEEKVGIEAGTKPERRRSLDKTPRQKRLSIEAQQKNDEIRTSPTKRRLSVDKTDEEGIEPPRTRCSSVEKTPKRLSTDKSPHGASIENTPNRSIAEVADQVQLQTNKMVTESITANNIVAESLPVNNTVAESLLVNKSVSESISAENTLNIINSPHKSSQIPKHQNLTENTHDLISTDNSTRNSTGPDESKDYKCGYSSNKILKGLLNAAEKKPKSPHHFSPYNTLQRTSVSNISPLAQEKPSTSKEGNLSESENKEPRPVAFFMSPQVRSSSRLSPIVRTPVIEVDLIAEKLIAPHKGPNSVNSANDIESQEKITNPEVEVIVEKLVDQDEVKKLDEVLNKKTKETIKIIDDYVIKPTEPSTVMDGIVPLQPVSKAPKPLDLLKNEIISENAEVVFDPIVPLPSPSKVRPKLRPVPRLGPRRNSFQQGSASESEDENRLNRLLGRPSTPATPGNSRQRHDSHTSHATAQSIVPRDVARVRNDSVCSTVSQAPSQAAIGSPLREREKSHKSRRDEMTARRNAAMRRRQLEVERDKLTMYDLIFYNPKANPIIPDQDEIKAKEANKKEDEERQAEAKKEANKVEPTPEAAPAAVPQIKLGPNGEIILDEQSLVVNQSEQRKIESSVVREGAWGGSGSRAYRRTPRTADWSDAETVRFYRALAAMGTDFTLMQPLFPTRTRRDLKLKFKKEERLNLAQVDMALRSHSEWDPAKLEAEFTQERQDAEEALRKAKERLLRAKEEEKERNRKSHGVRRSKCAKSLEDSALPKLIGRNKIPCTLDEYVKLQEERQKKQRNRSKKGNPDSITVAKAVSKPDRAPCPPFASLTLVDRETKQEMAIKKPIPTEMATITKEAPLPVMPPNIETGSLVVLTVNDPQSPSRKMLQTYIAQGPGNLVPVSLPSNFLNSVVGVMKKNKSATPKPNSPSVSLEITKPNIISPRKRKSSYTITQL